jgi:outer membrane protein assembly factor BamB
VSQRRARSLRSRPEMAFGLSFRWTRCGVRSENHGKYSASAVRSVRARDTGTRGRWRHLRVPVFVVAGLLPATLGWPSASTSESPAVTPAHSGFGSHWSTYHGNAEATGVHAAHTDLLPSKSAWTSPVLDGQIYGEPLVADGRVVAATENDTVYVLAADSGMVLWSRHLATPVPSGDLPCGDISPEVGITGTPVIDVTRHEIFVDADTLISGPAASRGVEASHRLFGLDLFTGKIELDQHAMPNAGEDQLAQLQRPGLALDHGHVVIAYGQNAGDCPGPNGPAHGFVVSIPETGGHLRYFQIGRGQDRGAVWMGGSSPVIDPHGNVYVASADGYDLGAGQKYDDSDAVLELSPSMQLESIFYPSDWQTLSADDLDLGTGDPALVDGFVFQIGKTDIAYLLRQGNLGGEEGEVASLSMCDGNPDGGHAVEGSVVYVPCPNGVTAVQVSTTAPYLKQLWTANDGVGGGPIVADGLVWTIGGNAVHALNPANGNEVLSIPFGGYANHFPTPSVGDGLLLLPGTDQVFAFMGPAGLPPPPTKP